MLAHGRLQSSSRTGICFTSYSKGFTAKRCACWTLRRHQAPAAVRDPEFLDQASSSTSAIGIFPPLFLAGAVMGTLLDGIHGTVHLLDYKVGAYDIAGLHSSIWVAPLLGTFYAVIGLMHTALDSLAMQPFQGHPSQIPDLLQPLVALAESAVSDPANAKATQAQLGRQSWPYLALNTGVIALLLAVSAVLYERETPYLGISAVLSLLAIVSWKVFDGTKQGLLLAFLCALSAPLSELVLINVFGLWQYPHPDVFGEGGVPSWVFWCYFFYTSGVGNLARQLKRAK